MTGFLLSFVIGHKKMKITGNFVALLCNRPSDIYSLTGFSEKVSLGRQIFHHVAPYYQVAVCLFQKYTNDICWVCKSRTGEATNGAGKITGT